MVQPLPVQFAQFRPDLSDYNPAFSDAVLNVEPRADGFGPLLAFSVLSADLGSRCHGAVSTRQGNLINRIFAGTRTALYRFAAAGLTFDDVTRSSGGDYTTDEFGWWSFAQFGGRLIACNGVDATQWIDIESGSNFAALSNAPIAYHVATVGDFLVFGNLSTDSNAVQWSSVNNSEDYTNGGSDIQSFPDGGPVQGIVGHTLGAVVFQRDKFRVMEWRGDDLVWGFRVVQERIGCFAPRSIVSVNNTFFWYSDGGFYMGMEAVPIGDGHVNKYVESIFNPAERQRLVGTVDPTKNLVWWSVTRADGTRKMIGYDYVLQQWTQAETDADLIFPAYTPGYTIDDLGTLGYTMDTIPYSFDSSFWSGKGELILAGFNEDGEFGYFQSSNLAATLETTDIQLNPGGEAFLQSTRLVSDAPVASVSVEIGTRKFPGDSITWGASVNPNIHTGRAWHRSYAHTHRMRWTIAAGTSWNNANGATVYANAAGNR